MKLLEQFTSDYIALHSSCIPKYLFLPASHSKTMAHQVHTSQMFSGYKIILSASLLAISSKLLTGLSATTV